jgi:uncharacterized protein
VKDIAAARYVSLATFRRSGAMVATPVWAAVDGDDCFVFSAGDAGKVKRLKNSSEARLAICSVRGQLLGPWQDAQAEIIEDPTQIARALTALRSKYGVQMWLADVLARLSGRMQRRAYIKVRLVD